MERNHMVNMSGIYSLGNKSIKEFAKSNKNQNLAA